MVKPIATCAIIMNENKELLLIFRANDPRYWSFIGGVGSSQKGMPPEEAVKDEVMFDINTAFNGTYFLSYPLKNADYADEVQVFMGSVDESKIKLNPQAATTYQWFSLKDAHSLGEFAFNNQWLLDELPH